jgi:hypothetical protein
MVSSYFFTFRFFVGNGTRFCIHRATISYDTEKLFSDVASSLPKIEDLEAILSEE